MHRISTFTRYLLGARLEQHELITLIELLLLRRPQRQYLRLTLTQLVQLGDCLRLHFLRLLRREWRRAADVLEEELATLERVCARLFCRDVTPTMDRDLR